MLRIEGQRRFIPGKRGVAYLELILALPILLIFLAATIEFGVIMANLKYLPLASRAGAKVLAESADPSLALASVEAVVNETLSATGMTPCKVTIKYNYPNNGSQSTGGSCPCDGPAFSTFPTQDADTPYTVSVTVCVEVSQMAPDLLGMFGFSLAGRVATSTTIYPYEGA